MLAEFAGQWKLVANGNNWLSLFTSSIFIPRSIVRTALLVILLKGKIVLVIHVLFQYCLN